MTNYTQRVCRLTSIPFVTRSLPLGAMDDRPLLNRGARLSTRSNPYAGGQNNIEHVLKARDDYARIAAGLLG